MKSHYYALFVISVALATTPVLADNNASGGDLTDSETHSFGAGPFNHSADIGDADNSLFTGITFTGGFTATHVRFTGTLTSVIPATFGREADIQVTAGSTSFVWQNPGDREFDTFDYDSSQDLTGEFAGGIDPGSSSWQVEFFDEFDDTNTGDANPNNDSPFDSQSTNVDMIFEAYSEVVDTIGDFDLGSLSIGDTNNSIGEFALPSLYDTYTITLNEEGLFTFFVDEDPGGFVGTNIDTEIGIFDSAGNVIAEDDDRGNGLYSGIFDLQLAAGDYTLAVAPHLDGASFENDFVVNPGTLTGDYVISASLVSIPEPGTMALLGFGCIGLMANRRRK